MYSVVDVVTRAVRCVFVVVCTLVQSLPAFHQADVNSSVVFLEWLLWLIGFLQTTTHYEDKTLHRLSGQSAANLLCKAWRYLAPQSSSLWNHKQQDTLLLTCVLEHLPIFNFQSNSASASWVFLSKSTCFLSALFEIKKILKWGY